jgi:hypothetical protein
MNALPSTSAVFDPAALIRPAVASMQPYTPILPFEVLSEQLGRPVTDIIKLDANENPYGPSPKALEAMHALSAAMPVYPDPESRKLRAMLGDFLGVDMAHILVGAGADELIDLIGRLILDPGDAIIDCPPTFGMYPFDASLAGARVINVPRRADFSLDVDALGAAACATNARLLFVASPNNPDGGLLSRTTWLASFVYPHRSSGRGLCRVQRRAEHGAARAADPEPDRLADVQQVGRIGRAARGIRHFPARPHAASLENQAAVQSQRRRRCGGARLAARSGNAVRERRAHHRRA